MILKDFPLLFTNIQCKIDENILSPFSWYEMVIPYVWQKIVIKANIIRFNMVYPDRLVKFLKNKNRDISKLYWVTMTPTYSVGVLKIQSKKYAFTLYFNHYNFASIIFVSEKFSLARVDFFNVIFTNTWINFIPNCSSFRGYNCFIFIICWLIINKYFGASRRPFSSFFCNTAPDCSSFQPTIVLLILKIKLSSFWTSPFIVPRTCV